MFNSVLLHIIDFQQRRRIQLWNMICRWPSKSSTRLTIHLAASVVSILVIIQEDL